MENNKKFTVPKKYLVVLVILFVCLSFLLFQLELYDDLFEYFGLSYDRKSNFVRFIDVGMADCTMVQNGGKVVLVDTGHNYDDGNRIYKKLLSYGIKEIDCIIISHAHSDHAGGLPRIIEEFEVDTVYCTSGAFSDDSLFSKTVIRVAKEKGTEIKAVSAGESVEFGKAVFSFIWLDTEESEDLNDNSIVTMLECEGHKFFLGGDITATVEKRMLAAGVNVDCDVLKASHHGSAYSSCDAFLDASTPDYCVVSCSDDNLYNFPSNSFLMRMENHNIDLFSTAISGDITFDTDTGEISLGAKK